MLPTAARHEFEGPAGRLCLHDGGPPPQDDGGPPVLLVHSINAAASWAEMWTLFAHLRRHRRVFAIDLPGYGDSDRPDVRYTPGLMTEALDAALQALQRLCGARAPDGVALSLSCEFLARSAARQPARWGRLVLISPTGFDGTSERRGPPDSTRGAAWLHAVWNGPGGLWGEPVFRALTRPRVVRYFLRRTWGGEGIDETVFRAAVRTARAPGARHAPLWFLTATLFSADIDSVYDALDQPVWMVHGTRGDFTDYRRSARVARRPNWRIDVMPGGAMPHVEHAAAFATALDGFLAPR